MPNTIHLACVNCSRQDYRDTTLEAAKAAGWVDILETPIMAYRAHDGRTHDGWCPDCKNEPDAETTT